MKTKEQVKVIINNPNAGELEKISVIVKYIFDKTKEDISVIPIRKPEHVGQRLLMDAMFNVAKEYYKNEGK